MILINCRSWRIFQIFFFCINVHTYSYIYIEQRSVFVSVNEATILMEYDILFIYNFAFIHVRYSYSDSFFYEHEGNYLVVSNRLNIWFFNGIFYQRFLGNFFLFKRNILRIFPLKSLFTRL